MMRFKRPYNYARKNIVFCSESDKLAYVAQQMLEEKVGSVIIVDSDKIFQGLLTYQTILRHVAKAENLSVAKVGKLDLDPLIYASWDAPLKEVMEKFTESPSGRILLTNDEGHVVGILKKTNLSRFSTFMLGTRHIKPPKVGSHPDGVKHSR